MKRNLFWLYLVFLLAFSTGISAQSPGKITEDFSDFKPEGNITLPHGYRISYLTTGTSNGSTEIEFIFNLTEFAFNQNLAANTFDIDVAN